MRTYILLCLGFLVATASAGINSFTVAPTSITTPAQTATLSWNVTVGDTISIDNGALATTTASVATGNVSVTPAGTKTYTLTNTSGGITTTAQVTVLANEPTVPDLSFTVGYQTATAVTLAAQDPNTPVASLNFAIPNPPANGVLSGTGVNRTYTPNSGYEGPDSFTYQASDAGFTSNLGTVTINVLPAPAPPTDFALSAAAYYTNYAIGSFAGAFVTTDPNPDDQFTFALVTGGGDTHNAYFSIVGNQLISQHSFAADAGQNISIRVRVTDSANNTLDRVFVRLVVAADVHVKINEINYNPAEQSSLSEFIELYNPFDTSVDISGWSFTKGIDYTFPGGTSIAPHGFIVVAQDPPTMQAIYGVTALGPWTGALSGDGEEIELSNSSGITVDKVDYGVSAPWPVKPNGDGPTLELVNADLENNLGGNWRASAVAPTTANYITAGSSWRYRVGVNEASSPVGNWRTETFTEDASWRTGTTPIGLFKMANNTSVATLPEASVTLGHQLTAANTAQASDMATYLGNSNPAFSVLYRCVYFRKTFNVAGAIPKILLLRVMRHDATVVWINGVEVARFGFSPGSPADPPFNYGGSNFGFYESSGFPWVEKLLTNVGSLLHAGTNVLTIQGFAKPPQLRAGTNWDGGSYPQAESGSSAQYNLFDFCVDAELKNAAELMGTPGAQNSVFASNNAPAIRNVEHTPITPRSWEPIRITAKISDPQGVSSVQLSYQICAPGSFIPSTLPWTVSQLIGGAYSQPLQANPAFENPVNWTTVSMVDNGSVPGDIPGDGVFTATIPKQTHRSLVRYRITASDIPGLSVRVPALDDPRKNYACFVYDGVPVYVNGSQVFGPATMSTLPVYQWIIRPADFTSLLAYNSADQFSNVIDYNVLASRKYENFEVAFVSGEQVIDHTFVRLRGGNSRYKGTGKRHFRVKFPKGNPFHAIDERGNPYPRPWEQMLFNKMFGNKGYYDWGLPYEVGAGVWRLQGLPMPESHWFHFRVVQGASEAPTPTTGDFYGMFHALEFPDGKNFLEARDLPKGNFYKTSDWEEDGDSNERYKAPTAVQYGEDFDNVRYNVHPAASETFIKTYVNMPLWYRFHAVVEAVRDYDKFIEPTGRNRMKNMMWYFHPMTGTNGLGQGWLMPYDWDSSFGPTFNSGREIVKNAIYRYVDIPDSPTWTTPVAPSVRANMQIERRNAIREFRDLFWYRDVSPARGPFDDLMDEAFAKINLFWRADLARWPVGTTGATADNAAGAPFKVQDMKNFAFVGWTDTVGSDASVGSGGRAAYLDSISDNTGETDTVNDDSNLDTGRLPAKPTITYTGSAGFPVDGLTFSSSAFSDPQGAGTFSAMQWRVGEITDTTSPAYDPTKSRVFEITPVWESGDVAPFNASIAIPPSLLRVGHTYRARVRHKDNTGRWGHWSAPTQFTATGSNYAQVLKDNLMVTELMYRPAVPTAAESGAGYVEGDFEYAELRNISPALTLDLSNVRFTKGVDFDFAGSSITSLTPGARVLVVKNSAAFTMRHGAGKPVAGVWESSDNLSNQGEQVKLSFGAGAAIHDFIYDDLAPWPTQAALGGYSLVLKNPTARPDHALAENWRASLVEGGTPGGGDGTTFDAWAATNGVSDPNADSEGDGAVHLLEYVLVGNPSVSDATILPQSALQSLQVDGVTSQYLTLTFRRLLGADDTVLSTEWSQGLSSWSANGVLVSSIEQGDGTVVEIWRAPLPISAGSYFGRVRVLRP